MVEDVDRNAFERYDTIFLGECAIPVRGHSDISDPLNLARKISLLVLKIVDPALEKPQVSSLSEIINGTRGFIGTSTNS